jgi:hypothetical protein
MPVRGLIIGYRRVVLKRCINLEFAAYFPGCKLLFLL